MDEEISVPRFPILGFRIPNSVWHMGNLEYRTMRLGDRGDDPETDFGMIGHGVTWSDMGCRWGVPGHLVLNRNRDYWQRKEGTHTQRDWMAYS